MSTTFESLPIVDLSSLKSKPDEVDLKRLSDRLYHVFSTTGFAYLVNIPLSYKHAEVFGMTREFFQLPLDVKMRMAKRTFRKENKNTYRGYFPTQPDDASDNLKEGFEMGPKKAITSPDASNTSKFNLSEPNVWPDDPNFTAQPRLEHLYEELQSLASMLLSLLAVSLGKDSHFFDNYLDNSLSTLRLLHYPAVDANSDSDSTSLASSFDSSQDAKLSCTQHTDSGILTLLHQDATGGLQVQDASGKWVSAPYIPESLVVNIGDLMAKVSGGQFVATMHRVLAPKTVLSDESDVSGSNNRLSVPFFFEPGEHCVVKSVDENDQGIVYGDHMRSKMKTWVEYQDI